MSVIVDRLSVLRRFLDTTPDTNPIKQELYNVFRQFWIEAHPGDVEQFGQRAFEAFIKSRNLKLADGREFDVCAIAQKVLGIGLYPKFLTGDHLVNPQLQKLFIELDLLVDDRPVRDDFDFFRAPPFEMLDNEVSAQDRLAADRVVVLDDEASDDDEPVVVDTPVVVATPVVVVPHQATITEERVEPLVVPKPVKISIQRGDIRELKRVKDSIPRSTDGNEYSDTYAFSLPRERVIGAIQAVFNKSFKTLDKAALLELRSRVAHGETNPGRNYWFQIFFGVAVKREFKENVSELTDSLKIALTIK